MTSDREKRHREVWDEECDLLTANEGTITFSKIVLRAMSRAADEAVKEYINGQEAKPVAHPTPKAPSADPRDTVVTVGMLDDAYGLALSIGRANGALPSVRMVLQHLGQLARQRADMATAREIEADMDGEE